MPNRPPADFVIEEGQLRYYAAPLITFTVRGGGVELYVAQVGFQKSDGSLFVQAPYFRHPDGIVTRVELEADGSFPITVDFRKNSFRTSHRVKLSHKPNGFVHFSQDNKVYGDRIFRTASFPLTTKFGTVFHLHAFRPAQGFPSLGSGDKKAGRLYLPFDFGDELPEGIRIEAKWRRKADVPSWTDRGDVIVGPNPRLVHRNSGVERRHFLVGQPAGFALRDHILDVYCDPVTVPANVEDPMMLLMGGYDSDEVLQPGDPAPPSEYLAWWYPIPNPSEIETVLQSMDYKQQAPTEGDPPPPRGTEE